MFSAEIPPMAYTGISTLSQTAFRKSSPRGGSPFLQSVANTWPAVIYAAPRLSASTASSGEWHELPIMRNFVLSSALISRSTGRGRCIFGWASSSAVSAKLWRMHSVPYFPHISVTFSARALYSPQVSSFALRTMAFGFSSAILSIRVRKSSQQVFLSVTQMISDIEIIVQHRL